MKKYKKIISGMLVASMLLSSLVINVSAADTDTVEGGEVLKDLYEASAVTQEENNMNTLQMKKEDELAAQSIYLTNVMEVNAEYSKYYGGSYLDDGELVVLLTDTSSTAKSFVNSTIGNTPRFEKCDTSLQELNTNKEAISNYWRNHVDGADEDVNNMVDSIVSLGTDVKQNKILVGIKDCNAQKVKLFKENINDSEFVIFLNSAGPIDTAQIKAGQTIGIAQNASASKGWYSVGFRCKKLISGSNYAYGFVTAAHGNEVGWKVYSALGDEIGVIYSRSFPVSGVTDAAFVRVTGANYECVKVGLHSSRTYSASTYAPGTGVTLYMEGKTTGCTAGPIISTNGEMRTTYNNTDYHIADLYVANYAGAAGDSGGIVYAKRNSSYPIVGIQKGVDTLEGYGSNYLFSYIVKVNNIIADLGISLY